MATKLKSLKVDRVDLVPEGANSAAHITLFKGKEGKSMDPEEILEKMKPEHAAVIKAKFEQLEKAKKAAEDEAADAKADADAAKEEAKAANQRADEAEENAKKSCDTDKSDDKSDDMSKMTDGKKKGDGGTVSFDEDETLLKSLPAELQDYVGTLRKQKDAAEEVAKAAIAREKHAEAVSKAADLKALPIKSDALVDFIEKANPETVDMLETIAKAIDSTVLTEVGSFSKSKNDAWSALEDKASAIAKERSVTKAKGMSMAIDEYPDLYKAYLEGGAN